MTVHIIGAGLAGLAAAVNLTRAGLRVVVYERAGHGGGRCRSFLSPALGRALDNGNHLMLSGNDQAMAYVETIGASETLWRAPRAAFSFADLATGRRWSIRPGRGRLPWWLLDKNRRVPGSTVAQHLAALKLLSASPGATVADCFDTDGALYRLFVEPLAIAVLNTDPQEGAASLLVPVLKQTLGRGAAACLPCIPKQGLSETLVDPALEFIRAGGNEIRFQARVKNFSFRGDRLAGFQVDDQMIALADDDRVIVATPPDGAVELIPDLVVPRQYRAIVNAHFVLQEPVREPGFLGLINGFSQWVFVRHDMASVTISAATDLVERATEDIALLLWPEVCQALDLPEAPLPPYSIIKEKRATIAQTPVQERLRPGTVTKWRNLYLAGDWTATGLPATIEGAILSGNGAARSVLGAA